VTIAFGSDMGVGPHGQNAREFGFMVEAGMRSREAIEAATVKRRQAARPFRRSRNDRVRQSADVIAVDSSPLDDVSVLQRAAFVMARGDVHPGVTSFPKLRLGWGVGLDQRDLGRLVCEIRFDVCRQPTERPTHHNWNRGLINTGEPAPKARHVRLKVPALHNVVQCSQPLVLIDGGKNEAQQCVEMVTEIFARNIALCAEVPNPRLARYLGAASTRFVRLTPLVGPCWLLPNNARNLVGVRRAHPPPSHHHI
jgi:hypothetical protein